MIFRLGLGLGFIFLTMTCWWAFKTFSESEVKKRLKSDYTFFSDKILSIESLHYARGDFKIQILESDLIWTFNRFSGEFLGWSSEAQKLKNELR